MAIHSKLHHEKIIKLHESGVNGKIKAPSGRTISDVVYLVLEYVPQGILFDVCQNLGGMGEDVGRFFLAQILDYMKYMQKREVVHRDLKLENILIDDKMNIKVADFGFAAVQSPDQKL